MRITVDGSYCELSTKRKCDSRNWKLSAAFNSYLNTLQQKVFEAKRKLIESTMNAHQKVLRIW